LELVRSGSEINISGSRSCKLFRIISERRQGVRRGGRESGWVVGQLVNSLNTGADESDEVVGKSE